jgi:haloacetate dehalogenase
MHSNCSPLPELPPLPDETATRGFFPGFTSTMVPTAGAAIRTLRGGSGPPLLLLHGHPQTHVAWHKIAATLAQRFTVVLTDLRGYGDSSKPPGGERAVNYAPRTLARDQLDVMRSLGFERFAVAGHDRGGRVAHRIALDAPEAVSRLAVLDIAPTLTMYERTDKDFATRYVWWFFHIQPFPIPEHLIGMDPEWYLREHIARQCKTPGAVSAAALNEYLRCYCNRATIHAVCEDYRAAAGIGLELDAADAAAGRMVRAPLFALWGAKGVVGQTYDVIATWRERAVDVTGAALDCGHLLPEEAPGATLEALLTFFGDGR